MGNHSPSNPSPGNYSPPSGYSLPPRRPGLVKHVRVLAILMIIQGALECLLGLLVLSVGPLAITGALPKDPSGPPPVIIGVFAVGLGLLLLASGGLLIFAGIKNRRYRSRTLGLVALGAGAVSIITIYCAPTAIGLLIYGLVVYLNGDVRRAFELGEQGATSDQILKTI